MSTYICSLLFYRHLVDLCVYLTILLKLLGLVFIYRFLRLSYIDMLSANKECFTLFMISMALDYFSCLIVLTRTSSLE